MTTLQAIVPSDKKDEFIRRMKAKLTLAPLIKHLQCSPCTGGENYYISITSKSEFSDDEKSSFAQLLDSVKGFSYTTQIADRGDTR